MENGEDRFNEGVKAAIDAMISKGFLPPDPKRVAEVLDFYAEQLDLRSRTVQIAEPDQFGFGLGVQFAASVATAMADTLRQQAG